MQGICISLYTNLNHVHLVDDHTMIIYWIKLSFDIKLSALELWEYEYDVNGDGAESVYFVL